MEHIEELKRDIQIRMLEYAFGAISAMHSFLQRTGTPGHYNYVYSSGQMEALGRHANAAFSRHMLSFSGFFTSLQKGLNASSLHITPTSWNTADIIAKQDGGAQMMLRVLLGVKGPGSQIKARMNGTIVGYKMMGTGGTSKWSNVNKFKKAGILRSGL